MASPDRHGAPGPVEGHPTFADRTVVALLILAVVAFAAMLIWLLGR